jgi:two-component system osmolarity sensor histidine kinase EnvZ
MTGRPSSLAQQNAILLALLFILFELLAVAAAAGLVLVPMARRSADDMANLMILSAQTWSELPPATRADFEVELANTYQLALRAEAATQAGAEMDPWHKPYLYFLEAALNEKTQQTQHLSRETIAGAGWYWRSLPAGGTRLSVGFPERRIGVQPLAAILVSSLIGLALALLAAVWLARRSVVPLARLGNAAERVGRGEVLELLPETGPRELAALARRFNAMAIQVRDLLAARTTLLAGVSHDLRTPLARMRLALALLIEQPSPRHVERLEQDIGEMDRLIGKVLELARDLEPEAESEVDLQILFTELAAGTPVDRIQYRLTPEQIHIQAPLSALRRAIGNLLDNALRYGSGAPVDMVAEVHPSAVSIGILDRGPGIPQDQMAAVFHPFHRLESSRSPTTGGAGLGLAIVRQLADTHGWKIEMSLRPEGGLQVWLTLPIR